jgi:hypothetical protein
MGHVHGPEIGFIDPYYCAYSWASCKLAHSSAATNTAEELPQQHKRPYEQPTPEQQPDYYDKRVDCHANPLNY